MSVDFSKVGGDLGGIRDFAKGYDAKDSEHKKIGDEFGKSLFKSMDTDKSGDVTKEEFLEATKDSGVSEKDRVKAFEKLGGDDGLIQEKEMTGEKLFYDFGSTEESDVVEIMYYGSSEYGVEQMEDLMGGLGQSQQKAAEKEE